MKKCKDCESLRINGACWECFKTAYKNPDTGVITMTSCNLTRDNETKCGQRARWFKAKETMMGLMGEIKTLSDGILSNQ